MRDKKKSALQNVPDSVNASSQLNHYRALDSVICPAGDPLDVSSIAQNEDYNPLSSIEDEIETVFTPKKEANLILADSFSRIALKMNDGGMGNRSVRCRACGTFLQWRYPLHPVAGDKAKLFYANFCRDRLCPLCMKRRSLKMYSNVSDILTYLLEKKQERLRFIFLTLTIPNCMDAELSEYIDLLLSSFVRLLKRKEVKNVVKGALRVLEVTFNHNPNAKAYMTYHPHIHAILAVPESYFQGKYYLSHRKWLDMWRDVTGHPEIKFVNVKTIKPKHDIAMSNEMDSLLMRYENAIRETSKYCVKDSDFLFENDPELTDHVVYTLSNALGRRRLAEFYGCMREASHKLNQEDAFSDNADLIITDGKNPFNPELAYVLFTYHWGCGSYHFSGTNIISPVNSNSEVV